MHGDRLVDAFCTKAPTGRQDGRLRRVQTESANGFVPGDLTVDDRASDRVTGNDDPVRREELLHSVAGDEDAVGLFAQQDIALSRKGVAFMDKRRYPLGLRRPQHGKAGVSSYPDNRIRLETAQDAVDLEEAADELKRQP